MREILPAGVVGHQHNNVGWLRCLRFGRWDEACGLIPRHRGQRSATDCGGQRSVRRDLWTAKRRRRFAVEVKSSRLFNVDSLGKTASCHDRRDDADLARFVLFLAAANNG